MLSPEIATVGLGLASAASWGAADFSGGLATRRSSVFGVTIVAQAAGVVLLVVLAFALAEPAPSRAAVGWSSLAGLVGSVGIAALYRALAVGQMGIAAPVTAVLSAGLPVLFHAYVTGLPSTAQAAGFGMALIGVWLLSRPDRVKERPPGFGLALVSGLGFGGFLILIAQASPSAVLWPLAVSKAASLMTLLLVAFSTRRAERVPAGLLPLILLAGVLDVGGNAFFMLAAHLGRLDVAAVLSSLYPASTVLLAGVLLGERVSRTQAAGIALALIAIPMIARA
jgi:drug/metabolite transporter (DMT)-like permease